ncbi:uncharacterized protein LOC143065269 [Mytilus galloprovincialis]|uniref:uncharacterized protein LOC143065269 n=1 Tax=Mytilus galloprovincialis TaxID=29158 RepID=UPI003F7BE719
MKTPPFYVILICGFLFILFKTDTSSLKIDVELCSNSCKFNNSACDDKGQCKCTPGWYGDGCNYTNDCKLAEGGINYNGSVNISQGGFPCLYWNDSTYHKDFPMQHNYCRALAEEDGGIPWCYLNQEKSGRYWDYCNIPICVCETGKFGENCEHSCHCKTSGCGIVNGHCYDPGCVDGWSGDRCDECQIGRFGNNCEQICHCKTPICTDISKKCKNGCSEGWKGDNCDECTPHRFGQNCEKSCHCLLGGCDNKTGVCFKSGCLQGWNGESCNYTYDCKFGEGDINYRGNISVSESGFPCLFWNDTTYHKYYPMQHNYCRTLSDDDGGIPWCYINQEKIGRYWDYCDIPICVCEPGRFGANCQTRCHCKTSGCRIADGLCNEPGCVDGWSGDSCDECQIGRFGNNCEQICYCNTSACTDISSKCKDGCSGGWKGDNCDGLEKSESQTTTIERDGILMSYGLFGGVLTTINVISAGVYIGACFYHRRRIRKHIAIYEDLQLKSGQSEQRQTVTNDDNEDCASVD